AVQLAGFSWGEVDAFRKAMGKKIPEVMAKYHGKFVDGCGNNGIAAPTAEKIWAFIEPFAGYGFNKCAHGSTEIQLCDGRRMTLSAAYRNPTSEIMAMWPDGQIRPHKVAHIVRTGRKPLLKICTASGKSIQVTPEHRLLTTTGYRAAGEMQPGLELIVASTCAQSTILNRTSEQRTRSGKKAQASKAAHCSGDQRRRALRTQRVTSH